MLGVQSNSQDVNLLELGVESTGDDHSLAFETMDQVRPIEAVDVVSDG